MNKTQYSFVIFGCLTLLCVLFSLTVVNAEAKNRVDHHLQKKRLNMNIRIQIEGSKQPISVTLIDSPTTQDFIQQLPLTLTLKDYAASEKITHLPQKLSTQSAPKGYAGKSGDLTYFAPWGNLAFFYKDSDVGYANGLIFLGKMDILPNDFSQKDELKILISQVK